MFVIGTSIGFLGLIFWLRLNQKLLCQDASGFGRQTESSPQLWWKSLSVHMSTCPTFTKWTENHHMGFEIVMMLITIYGISYLYTYFSQHYLQNINSVHFVSCLERIIELSKTQTLTFPMLHTSYLLLHWAPPHHLPNLHHTRAYIYIYWTKRYIEYIYIYILYIYM